MPRSAPLGVVMPVHNALPHLDAAVRSILDQTYRDFEFVIYDDGSTDGSTARLREWARKDERIRVFEGKRNLGMVGSSAIVVEHSTAPLVARMDADDISAPDRLERQIALLEAQPEAGLVGTLLDIIDDRGRRIRSPDYWRLARKSAFVPFAAHGSIMFRRAIFDAVGGYRPECEYWEDQDLVMRMAAAAPVWVIPEPLYRIRQWARADVATQDRTSVENAVDLLYRCVARIEQRRAYDDLLKHSRSHQPDLVDPRVFISSGSKLLWTGGRPKVFGRLLKRGRLRFDRASAMALVWTAWAAVSPATLRLAIRGVLWARNARASGVRDSEPFTWSPDRVPETPVRRGR